MSIKWKIFKVANIAEVTLVTGFIASVSYTVKLFEIKSWISFSAFLMVVFLSASVITNSINNIALLTYLKTGKRLSRKKKTLFWMLVGISFLFSCVATWAAFKLFSDLNNPIVNSSSNFKNIGRTVWMFIMGANGYLTLSLQVALFYKIRKHSSEVDSLLVNTIGLNNWK